MIAANQRGLLDTNIVINFHKLSGEQLPENTAISSVTLAELAAGVHLAHDPKERAARLELLQLVESIYEPLSFDVNAARAYGSLTAAVRAIGRSPRARVADQMIAAIAAANDLPLYTTNEDDFRGMEGYVRVIPVLRPSD